MVHLTCDSENGLCMLSSRQARSWMHEWLRTILRKVSPWIQLNFKQGLLIHSNQKSTCSQYSMTRNILSKLLPTAISFILTMFSCSILRFEALPFTIHRWPHADWYGCNWPKKNGDLSEAGHGHPVLLPLHPHLLQSNHFSGLCVPGSVHDTIRALTHLTEDIMQPIKPTTWQKNSLLTLFSFSNSVTKRQRPNWSLSGISNGFPVLRSNMNPRLEWRQEWQNDRDGTLELPTQSWCPVCPAQLCQNSSWGAPAFPVVLSLLCHPHVEKHLWRIKRLCKYPSAQPFATNQSRRLCHQCLKDKFERFSVHRLSRKNICVWGLQNQDAAKQSENLSSSCEFLWN